MEHPFKQAPKLSMLSALGYFNLEWTVINATAIWKWGTKAHCWFVCCKQRITCYGIIVGIPFLIIGGIIQITLSLCVIILKLSQVDFVSIDLFDDIYH